jgi:hypothetical protein
VCFWIVSYNPVLLASGCLRLGQFLMDNQEILLVGENSNFSFGEGPDAEDIYQVNGSEWLFRFFSLKFYSSWKYKRWAPFFLNILADGLTLFLGGHTVPYPVMIGKYCQMTI